MSRFFVSTPLGFEERTLADLKAIWPHLLGKDAKPHGLPCTEVQVLEGGLEFEADLFIGLQLNFFLKTANRVLLRMASFKARDLPKFYQKFKSLPWLEYLASANVEWEVAAKTSRLNNEKRLQESAEQALTEIFANIKPSAQPCGSIFIRMEDDVCTISLDTTGEHLHKRGWTVLKGEAPLRETIASFLIKELVDGDTDLSEVTLFDPMMGAGTFLTEARSLAAGQFVRPFAFQKWKKAPKLFLSNSFAFNYSLPPAKTFKKFIGKDINSEMLEVVEKNFQEVERQISLVQKKAFSKADLDVSQGDSLMGPSLAAENLWMIVNPPYGERLPTASGEGLKGLAHELCSRYTPRRIGLLYPDKEKVQPVPQGYRRLKEIKINNGGIRCLYTVLTRL
ncbi:RNA methyltransferase [Bdellovibrio reynosensis]|uniref:RNA methyltransferase n=1 Tax=Bdellovibrio reynosensis TaxID=2835041 RepID=A0ABY4C9S4_9BACT|nr:RNA methyltransferase [Bdellovibrio reynosensis]UOF01716.1 RNA methyltransferase [Bdellovibrio reynosensis]